jgi:hypothetical protein
MKITLNNIRKHLPCSNGWTKLLKSLNKTTADDEVLEMSTILESNGLGDALWCLRSIEGIDKECRLYAVFCARQFQHLNDDPRVSNAIDVAERFANGEATVEELNAAADVADVARAYDESAAADAAYCVVACAATYVASYDAAVREAQKQKFIEMFC